MKNVLVFEDDEDVVEKIFLTLNREQFSIDLVNKNRPSFQNGYGKIPELVICNLNLVGSKEFESFNYLRDENSCHSVPFIFLVDENIKKKKITNTGFDYFIHKPFNTNELLKIIEVAYKKFDTVLKKSEKRLDELRGSISFSIPHEFFTPVNGILGFSDILIKEFDTLEKQEAIQMLKFIYKDALRLKGMTENIVAFTELEMISNDPKKVRLLRESYFINPNDLISEISVNVAKQFNRFDDLVLDLEDHSALRMSEGYLRKILSEIISNAFKFSTKGGQVFISTISNDTSLMISVTDSGRGMKNDQINSIGAFMQFNREKYDQQGPGLGLTIAKKICKLHGGEFIIESRVDEGTKITMIFEQ